MLQTIASDNLRVLCFRRPRGPIRERWPAYLAFGLLLTWLAGMGRYWDSPRAEWWQLLGLGSLAYVIALGLLLWLMVAPLRPPRWSLPQVLVFVCFCSPPALLYAIPVERFLSLAQAQSVNLGFLAVVACWRMALLCVFLRRGAGLPWGDTLIALLLPVALIVVALSALNLEHVVFRLMAGVAPEERSPADLSYLMVLLLSWLSIMAAPVLLLWYGVRIYLAWRPAAVVASVSRRPPSR